MSLLHDIKFDSQDSVDSPAADVPAPVNNKGEVHFKVF